MSRTRRRSTRARITELEEEKAALEERVERLEAGLRIAAGALATAAAVAEDDAAA